MGWFARLVGTDKAVDNILDKDNGLLAKAGSWFGGLNYTEEEKAEANADQRRWGIEQLNALAPFKVVQRILAFSATFLWIVTGLNVLAAMWLEAFINRGVHEKDQLHLVDELTKFALSDYVFWPVITVYALYFSGGVVESVKKKLGK